MKKLKLMLLGAASLLWPAYSYAQTMSEVELNKITQVSPNAASLGKYGEYQVGLYTGIPDITISLYEISTGRIKVPISLSYNASGIRVEEIASSVGLGWSLNSGGVITRSVRGAPDELAPPGSSSFLTTAVTVDSMKTLIDTDPVGNTAMLKKIAGTKIDAEPDVFYFNLGGRSGKFMYHQKDAKFYSIPYSKMKIEFTNSFGGASSFTLIDEDGIVYLFDEMEVNTKSNASSTTTTTSAWFLREINDPVTGRSVIFSYNHNTISYDTFGTETHYYNSMHADEIISKQSSSHAITSIKEITFNAGKIRFTRGLARTDLPGDSAVTEIKVLDLNNQLIKDYDLSYDYFSGVGYSGPITSANYRLKLLAVDEYSTDGNHNNPLTHSFDYNTSVPSRLSKGQDHWGYYNGQNGNTRLYPPLEYTVSPGVVVSLAGGNRDVNASYATGGTLTKITYPTKGYTTFELESNSAGSLVTPILPKPAEAHISINGTDYAEGEFTMLASCTGNIHMSVTGFDDSYIPSGYPGFWIRISYENLATSETGDIIWIGDGKTGDLNPIVFSLPNGTYKITVNCIGNAYPDSYVNTMVNFSWDDCLPATDLETNNRLVGGLRIKKIKNYDENDNLTTMKYYKYVQESNPLYSSGISFFYPRYFDHVSFTTDPYSLGILDCIKRYSQSNYPLVDEGGKSVGYSNVIELNGETANNGYTQYKFISESDIPDAQSYELSNSKPVSYQWLRGLETERKVFKFNGSGHDLVSSIVNEYDTTLLAGQGKIFPGIRAVFRWVINDNIDADWPNEDYYFLGAITTKHEYFPAFSDFIHLSKTTTRTYNGANYLETVKNYTYNNRNLKPSIEDSQGSDGQQIAVVTKYPLDYTVTGATHPKSNAILTLQNVNNINAPIEQYSYKVLPNSDKLLTGANYYSYVTNFALPDTVFSYELPSSPILNYSGLTATASTFSKASAYQPRVIFDSYDINSNLLQQRKDGGAPIAYLYDYNYFYPVAEVVGAAQADIAYTSFEETNKGNWAYSGTISSDATSPTGKNAYSLTTSNTIVKTGLTAGTTYILSYWAKNNSAATISGTTATLVDSRNGWYRYECLITGVTSITLSGTVAVDEIRLHPKGSLMTTSTYNPLVGMSSSTDAKGMTTYYEYDEHNRLKAVKDQKSDIVKTLDYHFKP